MRILQIIPGTANFYCGGCIRDTALLRALRRLGHDVVLQPLYLPLFTDEPSVESQASIFFGGINVYLQQKTGFFRNTPRWIDRILDSRWLLNLSAKQAGMTKASELGEMTVSMLRGETGRQVKEFSRFTHWLKDQTKPDVIILPNGMLLGLAHAIKKEFDIPIVCTLQGEDAFLDALPEPYRTDAWQIFSERTESADAFIPVSNYYANAIKPRLNLASDKCFAVQNGISLDGFGEMNGAPKPLSLGYLAHLRKEKGLDVLVEAFIRLKRNPSLQSLKLKIAGTMTKADFPFVDRLKKQLNEAGVFDDVEFYPNVKRDEKIQFLKSLSVLSVPATYGEAFGLYVIEAMAAGIPVVQPRHGGFQEILERTNGGLLYEPDDMESYVMTLTDLLSKPEDAHRLGSQGRESVHQNFTVDRMAADVLQVLERVRHTAESN